MAAPTGQGVLLVLRVSYRGQLLPVCLSWYMVAVSGSNFACAFGLKYSILELLIEEVKVGYVL